MQSTDMMELTPFSTLIAAMQADNDRFRITLPPDWLQGRTAYGGLSAALCVEATLRAFPDLPKLRSAQFAFVGPATGELHIEPKILRQGKSAAFINADLRGESGLAVRAILCFGAERHLPHDYGKHSMPTAPVLEACPSYFTWPNRPNFMNHFEGRLAAGGAPLAGNPSPKMLVWLRHCDPAATGSIVSLVALADALPPASFASFREVVPISTMTWSFDVFDNDPESQSGWWLVHSTAETIGNGYSAQTAVIWHPDGRPILAGRQNVAIFGKRQGQ